MIKNCLGIKVNDTNKNEKSLILHLQFSFNSTVFILRILSWSVLLSRFRVVRRLFRRRQSNSDVGVDANIDHPIDSCSESVAHENQAVDALCQLLVVLVRVEHDHLAADHLRVCVQSSRQSKRLHLGQVLTLDFGVYERLEASLDAEHVRHILENDTMKDLFVHRLLSNFVVYC